MSWFRPDPDQVTIKVLEIRFTQGDAKLHSVGLSMDTASQHFTTSRFANPVPVDPVSRRSKASWPDTELRIDASEAEEARVKITIVNRRLRLRTVIGTASFTIRSLLAEQPVESARPGSDIVRTMHVDTTLLPALNLKIDIAISGYRMRSRSLHSIPTLYSLGRENAEPVTDSQTSLASDAESSASVPLDSASEVSSLGMPKPDLSARRGFGFDLNPDTLGVVFLEIVSIANLPRFRTLTGLSFDMDPFVIVGFGRRVYKTPHRRHTLNPTFNSKIAFDVGKSEIGYSVVFSVWDQDKITLNDKVAQVDLPVRKIAELNGPKIDKKTGLYDLMNHSPMVQVLPLQHEAGTAELVIKVHYYPMAAIRQQMWRGVIALYGDDLNTETEPALSFDTLKKLLGSLGSSLSDDTIREFFTKHSLDPNRDKLPEDLLVLELERIVATVNAERVLLFRMCPICHKKVENTRQRGNTLQHLSICASRHWAESTATLLDSKYVSSQQASKRWYANFLSKFSYGSYKLGAHSANILVQDRISGQISEEKMATSVRMAIRVIYALGPVEKRRFQRLLKKYTLRQGIQYSDPASANQIEPFIKFHNLDMSDVLLPVSEFKTFNEFFCRKLKPSARPCENFFEPRTAVSMADCRLSVFSSIDTATKLWIKGKNFTVSHLLDQEYHGNGSVVIFRLAPQDYHRVHSPVDGVIGEPKHIDGQYYTVNPMAIRSGLDVFGENTRTIFSIESPTFGKVMVVMVGAMMVGSCVVTKTPGTKVKRGEEVGYFQFGGSTVVILFEEGKFVPDRDLEANSLLKIETLVKVGMSVGHSPEIPEYVRTYDTRHTTIRRAMSAISGGGSYLPFSLD